MKEMVDSGGVEGRGREVLCVLVLFLLLKSRLFELEIKGIE